jgi:hypothetical protein
MSEERILIDNFDKTNEELSKLLNGRSKKAITRKLEKLREEGKIGDRSRQTIKRAYKQRHRRTKAEIMSDLEKQKSKRIDPDYEPLDESDDYTNASDDEYEPVLGDGYEPTDDDMEYQKYDEG